MFNLSATTVKPAVYCKSRFDLEIRLPVARKCSIFLPMLVYESISLFKYWVVLNVYYSNFGFLASFITLALAPISKSCNFSDKS